MPWKEVEELVVLGEEVVDPYTKRVTKRYPSYRELAKRYGVNHGSVAQQGAKRKWMQKRKEVERIAIEREAQQLIKGTGKSGALSIEEALSILDGWIRLFADDVKAKKVRTDSAADLNTLLRVRELLQGNADSRSEVQGQFTLEALQTAHKSYRDRVINVTPEVDGTAGEDEAQASGGRRLDRAFAGELPAAD